MESTEDVMVHEEEVEESKGVDPKMPMVIKMEKKSSPNGPRIIASPLRKQSGVPVISLSSPSSNPHCSCKKPVSRFADMARVWERKLEELPIEQALSIEKKMSDMLYEAMVVHIQTQKALKK